MTVYQYAAAFGNRFDASGLTGGLWTPALAALDDGRTAVVWTEQGNDGIWLRLFDASGTPEGAAIRVTDVDESGNRPAVALLNNGNMIVTYTALNTASTASINARVFTSDGSPLGLERVVFHDPVNTSVAPETVGLSGGGAITVFMGSSLDGDRFGVHAQLTDSNGTPIGATFLVNQTTESFQSGGVPVQLADGGFAVTWHSRNVDGNFNAVMLRTYDADGTPRSNEIRVNQYSYRYQTNPDITVLADGRIVVSWQSDTQDGSGDGVYARIYAATGAAQGNEFRVNTTTSNDQNSSSVAATPDGGFVVAWMNEVLSDTTDIRLQRYDATGNRVGVETLLPEGPAGVNTAPEITIGEDGLARVVWAHTIQNSLVTTTFVAVSGVQADGTQAGETILGSGAADILSGLGGDDILHGLNGTDTLIGGAGNDVLIGGTSVNDLRDLILGGDGDDVIDGGYGNDELRGDAGNDQIAGGFGADIVIGGAGDDVMTGSALSDLLYGGDGMDFVNGGYGHDRVNGGDGADRFFHVGVHGHGSDWIQDYDAAEGDTLLFGIGSADGDDFLVNFTHTASAAGERSGDDAVAEAFVIYIPTGQIMWALVDGAAQTEINILIGGVTYDLLPSDGFDTF